MDRERLALHNFVVMVADTGGGGKELSVEYRVSVLDVNDNSPTFQQDSFTVFLPGDTQVSDGGWDAAGMNFFVP